MPRPDPSNVIAGMTDDLHLTPNTPAERVHAAAYVRRHCPDPLPVLAALDLTDVHRCPPDTTGD